jgi:hypothetical protein
LSPVAAEQSLPAAVEKLYRAVSRLVDEQKQLVDGAILAAPSLYEQLVDAVAATARRASFRSVHRSMPVIWADAFDVARDIDDAVREWCPEGHSTPQRLRSLASAKWRPQDAQTVGDMVARVEAWTAKIAALLAPEKPKSISAPCPACGETRVYRKDSAGETVRQPALQITTQGCVCAACDTTWGPERFLFLAKVLGYGLPEGVLE